MQTIIYSVHHMRDPDKILAYAPRDLTHSALALVSSEHVVTEEEKTSLYESCFLPHGTAFTTPLEQLLWTIVHQTEEPTILAAAFNRFNVPLLTTMDEAPNNCFGADSFLINFIAEVTGRADNTFNVVFNEQGYWQVQGLKPAIASFIKSIVDMAALEFPHTSPIRLTIIS